MKLDRDKIKPNEEKSNHAMQAFSSSECKIASVCFYIACGFGGGISNKCQYLTDEGECLYEDLVEKGA